MNRPCIAVGILVALCLGAGAVSCGRTSGGLRPGPEHTQAVPANPPELPDPEPVPKKTLHEVERDLGLTAGTLKREMEAEYQAAAGDVLIVTFISHPRLSAEATVTPDGKIVLTWIGSVSVSGMTPEQVRDAVLSAAEGIGVKKPKVTVSVKTVAKKFVTFVGPGFSGGRVEIRGKGTVLETLVGSGWKPDPRAARRIALIRNGRTSIIDVDQITGLHEVDLNIKLHMHDILIALNQEPFEIKGAVVTPGQYALPPSGRVGLQDAIALAGGLKFPAEMSQVRILRKDGRTTSVDLNRYLFEPETQEPVAVQPGDTVYVPVAHETGVFVFGMVRKPGMHRVTGPVTVSRVIAQAEPERFGAVLHDCKLVRGYPKSPQVLRVDVERLFNGDTTQDLVMQDGDVLFVPESLGSDVLDTLNRILAPVSGAVTPSVQLYTASQIRR